MGLKGSVKEFSVSDIIQLIYYQRKTGRLTVRTRGRLWVLGFEKGMLVHASAEEVGAPRLGEILVRQGYLDRENLSAALREQEKNPRHLGDVLEELGLVGQGDIGRALAFQIQETALHLFFRADGEYTFERVPVYYDERYTTPINTEYLLMEGARRVDEWPAVRRVVQGGDAVFAPAKALTDERRAGLAPSELAVAAAVDGKRNVSELVSELGTGLFETCKTLAELARQGLIERKTEGSAPLMDPISGDSLPSEGEAAAGPEESPAAPKGRAAAARWPLHAPRGLLWMGTGLALLALSVALWLGLSGPPAP
jgi:Domain of unknown function (DUF4388)